MKTSLQTRFASFAFAAVMTLAILTGIDSLATSQPNGMLAQSPASASHSV
jgi:hypothetical protein